MLNYTSTTIINGADQFGTFKKKATDTIPAGFRVKFGPEFKTKDNDGGITHIYVAKASRAQYAKATVDLTKANDANSVYRIQVYIRTVASAESTYANDWTFKGKPLSLGEFKGATTAAEIVTLVAKHQLALYGENLVNVTAAGAGKIIITAKNQYQRFLNQDGAVGVELQKYVAGVPYASGQFETVANAVTVDVVGKEAFGDFTHIVKDLRLPTEANNRWYGIANGDLLGEEANADKPNPGTYYSQITVVYERNRGLGNADVLGGLARSRTVHVFYVADNAPAIEGDAKGADISGLASDFLKALQSVAGGNGTTENITVSSSVA